MCGISSVDNNGLTMDLINLAFFHSFHFVSSATVVS
jgi:hypothetical protein